MKEIFELLKQVLNREFIRAVLSNPRTKDGVVKANVRPLEKNGDFMFQVEKFTKTQAFHENINCKDAAEILAGGAAGEAVQQLLEQAQNLASSALELLGQYTAQKTPRKHSLLRKAAGAAILTGTALYLVPEWRRTVEDAVKVVADTVRDVK